MNSKLLVGALVALALMFAVVPGIVAADDSAAATTDVTPATQTDMKTWWNDQVNNYGLGTIVMLIVGIIAGIAFYFVRDPYLGYAAAILIVISAILIFGGFKGTI